LDAVGAFLTIVRDPNVLQSEYLLSYADTWPFFLADLLSLFWPSRSQELGEEAGVMMEVQDDLG